MADAINVVLIGHGLVGSEFVRQLKAYSERPKVFPEFKLCAVTNSRKMLLLQDKSTEKLDLTLGVDLDMSALMRHATQPCVIVDCTSSNDVAQTYPLWLTKGYHVVTPNKKAFSGDIKLYRDIKYACRKSPGYKYPICMHEATVGAGLPILSSLNDMILTGDKVVRIEGVFSGTLSYIFNEFSSVDANAKQVKFSEIVKRAKYLGFTEPDPRDDLNGVDVARKAVILARLANVDLSLETLSVENIVPQELRSLTSIPDFMAQLANHDDHFAKLQEDARAQQCVLRYVALVDGKNSSVKLQSYPFSHPFAQLSGTDNIVAFYTLRYPENPMIIRGAGAGSSVTSSGVMNDLIKIGEIISYARK